MREKTILLRPMSEIVLYEQLDNASALQQFE